MSANGTNIGWAIGGAAAATAAILLATSASRAPATLPADFDARVKQAVQAEITANPEIIVKSVNRYMEGEQKRQLAATDGKIVQSAEELAKTEGMPVIGNPNGKVTLVYFFDINCPYCKKLDPILKTLVERNPDLKLVHREIPILSPQSGHAARVAAVVWRKHPEKYAAVHDELIGHQGHLTDEATDAAVAGILGAEEAKAISESADNLDDGANEIGRAANNAVQGSLLLAQQAAITGTPFTYVVENGGFVRGAGEDAVKKLQTLIDAARPK